MLKTLQSLLAQLRTHRPTSAEADWTPCEIWRRDPLSHPELHRMSQRQLADLPMDPRRVLPHC